MGKVRLPPGATVVSFGGITLTDKASARIYVPRRNGRPQFLAAVSALALFCPICNEPVRRSKHARPAMACYITGAPGEILCLKAKRMADEAKR